MTPLGLLVVLHGGSTHITSLCEGETLLVCVRQGCQTACALQLQAQLDNAHVTAYREWVASAPREAPPPDESREVASEGAATIGSAGEDCTAQRQLTDALTAMDKVKAGINHHQQRADAGLRRAARAELVTVTARIAQPKRSLFTLSHVAVSAVTSPFGPHVFRHRLPVRTELVQCETRKRPLPWRIFSALCVMCSLALARCKEPSSTLAGHSTPLTCNHGRELHPHPRHDDTPQGPVRGALACAARSSPLHAP